MSNSNKFSPTPVNQQQYVSRWDEGSDPSRLDRAADVELAHGHYDRAERLARRAAEMRGAAQ